MNFWTEMNYVNRYALYLKSSHLNIVRYFILLFQEDLSYEVIAEELGINIGTVRSRIHRACNNAAELLEDLANTYMGTRQRNRLKRGNKSSPSGKQKVRKGWRRIGLLKDLVLSSS